MMRIFLLSVFVASQAIATEPTIHSNDTIILKVAGIPSDDAGMINNDDYHVDGSGSLRLPYLDKVVVGGLTAAEAAHLIEEDYVAKQLFTHPSITLSIKVLDPSVAEAVVEVRVGGQVQHPGKYRMKTPATIEQAFVLAGSWSGSGGDGMPANLRLLVQDVDGRKVSTHMRVHIDRKTKQIMVLDQTWKDYHLVEGDRISLAEVFS